MAITHPLHHLPLRQLPKRPEVEVAVPCMTLPRRIGALRSKTHRLGDVQCQLVEAIRHAWHPCQQPPPLVQDSNEALFKQDLEVVLPELFPGDLAFFPGDGSGDLPSDVPGLHAGGGVRPRCLGEVMTSCRLSSST